MMRNMAKNMIDSLKDPDAVKKMQQQSRQQKAQKAMQTQHQQKPSEPDSSSASSDEPIPQEIDEAIQEKMKALFGNETLA